MKVKITATSLLVFIVVCMVMVGGVLSNQGVSAAPLLDDPYPPPPGTPLPTSIPSAPPTPWSPELNDTETMRQPDDFIWWNDYSADAIKRWRYDLYIPFFQQANVCEEYLGQDGEWHIWWGELGCYLRIVGTGVAAGWGWPELWVIENPEHPGSVARVQVISVDDDLILYTRRVWLPLIYIPE